MGIPAIRLSEKTRKRLGLLSAVANFLCVIPSLVLFGLGGYMQVSVQDKVDLIQDYHGHYLPPLIICLGLIYLVINLTGGKICLDNTKTRKRKKMRVAFAAYIYVSTIMCILIILTAIFCLIQLVNLHNTFHNGIAAAMAKYRMSARMKEIIDKLQIEFRCCGNNGYRDWFSTPWIDEQYLNIGDSSPRSGGHYVSDDTPFSCCDVNAIRPCIHHRVHEEDHHFNYKYAEELTLYQTGCKQALMDVYGGKLLANVGIMVLVLSLVQIGVVVSARFLQTSILSTLKHGKLKGSAKAWLIPWPGSRRRRRRSEDTEVEEADEGHSSEGSGGGVLEDQSYSTHGLSGPAVPPPLPPSFGSAFDESNNYSNTNFSNVQRLPVAPPPVPYAPHTTPTRLIAPPVPPTPPATPPRLPPPPNFSTVSPLLRQKTRGNLTPQRLPFNSPYSSNPRQDNIPFRRQSNRTTQNIPIFQNGFYRNDFNT